jgi:7,8-dihydro-6-hydroxymethylpterin dimethyltransferase
MMMQPLVFAGRGAALADHVRRLTIPDVIRLLAGAGDPRVRAEDFAPLPCSHPLCFSLAYYLVLDDGGAVSLNRLLDASRMMDCLANRTIFGLDPEEHDRLKDLVYELWSGPAGSAPDSEAVLRTLRKALAEMTCSCFDPRQAFMIAERRIKSIFIHAFQDAETFDLARARRCCNAYPQTDGRLMPVCVRNVLRGGNVSPLEKDGCSDITGI